MNNFEFKSNPNFSNINKHYTNFNNVNKVNTNFNIRRQNINFSNEKKVKEEEDTLTQKKVEKKMKDVKVNISKIVNSIATHNNINLDLNTIYDEIDIMVTERSIHLYFYYMTSLGFCVCDNKKIDNTKEINYTDDNIENLQLIL
jgi:hypothetical protein